MGKFAVIGAALLPAGAATATAAAVGSAVVGFAFQGIGMLLQSRAQAKARKAAARQAAEASAARRRAEAAQQRQRDIAAARERRQQLREARIQRARIVSRGTTQGVSGSSAIAGGIANVQNQAASNISFIERSQQLSTLAATEFGRARDIMSRPIKVNNTFGQVFSFAGQAIGAAGKAGLFNPNPVTMTPQQTQQASVPMSPGGFSVF